MMIKEYKDELKNLKSIINETEKLKMTRQLEMEQAYEISKEIEELETKRIRSVRTKFTVVSTKI